MIPARPAPSRWTEVRLLIAPAVMTVIGLLTIVLVPRNTLEWAWSDLWVGLAFGGLALAVSFGFSIARFTGDQLLLPLVTAVSAIGLLMMQRLSPALETVGLGTIAQRQVLYLLLGMLLMMATALGLRRRLHLLRRYRYLLLVSSLGLLALTALPTLAGASVLFEDGQAAQMAAATPLVWTTVVWAGLVSSVLATSLVFWLVQRREAGRVTPYLLAAPVVSMAIGWGFMGDVLTPQILFGAAMTMAGVGVVALAERGLRAGAAKA